jgi:hypothetical protein
MNKAISVIKEEKYYDSLQRNDTIGPLQSLRNKKSYSVNESYLHFQFSNSTESNHILTI